jgi:subtilisin-like proprotein convertase family protein/uncharacterized protein YvpB
MQKYIIIILLPIFILSAWLILLYSEGSAASISPNTTRNQTITSSNATEQPNLTESPPPVNSETPSPSPTPSITPTPPPPGNLHFPIIIKAEKPTDTPTPTVTPTPIPDVQSTKLLICNNLDQDIPDNSPEGISSVISFSDTAFINDLDVRLDINHSWIGDLIINLTHQETGKTTTLIDRPGFPDDQTGCKLPDIAGILDDDIDLPSENECSTYPAAISGIYLPTQELSTHDGDNLAGNWLINIADVIQYDTGVLDDWCIFTTVSDSLIIPTPTPTVAPLPDSAIITGVTGSRQSLPLDCESRSAVDWANYYGVSISELDFFNNLPESDNPDLGFVGNVYGQWGQIPPNPYGVHTDPVANLLREYGLNAYAHRPLSWNQLRAEIAEGRPVIAWIVGNYDGAYEYVVNGIPEYYTPTEGYPMVVAPFEHTIIVTGYTNDNVYFLNGNSIYQKGISQFLESWSALGNMAITYRP